MMSISRDGWERESSAAGAVAATANQARVKVAVGLNVPLQGMSQTPAVGYLAFSV